MSNALHTLMAPVSSRPLHDLRALVLVPFLFQNWLTVYSQLRALQGYSRGTGGRHSTIRFRDGAIFTARANTIDIDILYNVYGLPTYRQPDACVESDDKVVIDIGGHIGAFAVWAARRAKGARVIAVEPDPDNAALLRENARRNGLSNITVHQGAVSDTRGTATLFRSPNRSCDHRLTTRPWEGVQVSTLTLADLFEKYGVTTCDFLKIDAEESEFPILLTASDDLLKRVRKIALEYHRAEFPQIVSRLESLGFTVRIEPEHHDLGMLYAYRIETAY